MILPIRLPSIRNYWRSESWVIVVFVSVTVTSCAHNKIKEPEIYAEIGDPLVFDSRRLLKELSERRLQIEREISNASIRDIDSTASIAATSAFSAGVSASVLSDQSTIDLYRSGQSAGIASNNNSIELQNLALDRLRLETEYSNEIVRDQATANDLRLELLEQQISSYSELLTQYKDELASITGDDDESVAQKAQIVAKIEALRAEMSGVSNTLQGTPSFAIPETLPTFTTPSSSSTTPASPSPEITFNNSSLDGLEGKLAALSRFGGTRAEKFQQYQSYLDELYASKNSFLIDDYHSRLGYRLVRVVFPIYVPPSDTNGYRKITFKVRKGDKSENVDSYDQIYQNALLLALNKLSLGRDDNLPLMSDDERNLNIDQIIDELRFQHKKYCPLVPEASGCTIYSPKCHRVNNAARNIGLKTVAQQCIYWDRSEKGWVRLAGATLASKFSNDENDKLSVFSISPKIEREKVDKTSSRLFALGASISEAFGSTSTLGNASISASYARELFAQSSSRTPVIASFTRKAEGKGIVGEFGWWVYPRVTIGKNNKVRYQHTGTQFYGTVDLSIPVSLGNVIIESSVEGNSDAKRMFDLEIPDLSYRELVASSFKSPIVDNPLDYGVVEGNKLFSMKLSGMNLWKHPEVIAGGVKADRIEFVAGSANDIIATFNNLTSVTCDYDPTSEPQFTYRGMSKNTDEYCAIRVMLHTSEGKDFAGSVLVKKETKKKDTNTDRSKNSVTGRLSTAKVKDGIVNITVLQNAENAGKVGDSFALIDARTTESRINKNQIQLNVTQSEMVSDNEFKTTLSGVHLRLFCLKKDGKYQIECPVEIRSKESLLYMGPLSFK